MYTTPCNGYAFLNGNNVIMEVHNSNETASTSYPYTWFQAATGITHSVYIPKGMKLVVKNNGASHAARFYRLDG